MMAAPHRYIRPLVMVDPARPEGALTLANGWGRFTHVEVLARNAAPTVQPVTALTEAERHALTAPRKDVAGLSMDRPRIMAILNVTPDSFSDGGRFDGPEAAVAEARRMARVSDMLDIGGESTRPGAAEVPVAEEIARTCPVIAALRREGVSTPISVDTRKAAVAEAALAAGADMVNDVSAMRYDPKIAQITAKANAPICLMHSQGTPDTMQHNPRYQDVVLDVYDHLANQIAAAEAAGIDRGRIIADPGIGFGKTVEHNLALLARLSLFHSLGCPVLLGVSRKRFIGTIGEADTASDRMPGSLTLAVLAAREGVQLLRVHDADETRQGLSLAMAQWGL